MASQGGSAPPWLPGLLDDNLLPDDGGDEGPKVGLLAPDGQQLANCSDSGKWSLQNF